METSFYMTSSFAYIPNKITLDKRLNYSIQNNAVSSPRKFPYSSISFGPAVDILNHFKFGVNFSIDFIYSKKSVSTSIVTVKLKSLENYRSLFFISQKVNKHTDVFLGCAVESSRYKFSYLFLEDGDKFSSKSIRAQTFIVPVIGVRFFLKDNVYFQIQGMTSKRNISVKLPESDPFVIRVNDHRLYFGAGIVF